MVISRIYLLLTASRIPGRKRTLPVLCRAATYGYNRALPLATVPNHAHMPDARIDDTPAQFQHISFYKFVHIAEPERCAEVLRELTAHVFGSILVACEGINGMLAGSSAALGDFEARLAGRLAFQQGIQRYGFQTQRMCNATFPSHESSHQTGNIAAWYRRRYRC